MSAVVERLAAFDEALALAGPRLDPELLAPARAMRAKVDERLARGDDVVVAALAGGTGSGKSSLFNALARQQLSEVGARRPVTSEVIAWAVGDPSATSAVLDWLAVKRRYHSEPTPAMPEGLVVLDLPDHDSVEIHHREISDAFVARVDVLVWVVDPLKYAQRVLHAGYLGRLATHADVVVVVLNQIDRLTEPERRACLADLRRLLAEEGLERARVLATSAATGEGVDDLRALLADEARRRRAVGARLTADVRSVAAALRAETGGRVGASIDGAALVTALGTVAGVGALAEAARARYRATARSATRPLISRLVAAVWTLAMRPFRFGSPARRPTVGTAGGSQPSPASVRHALSRVARVQGEALPRHWRSHLRTVLADVASDLPAAVGRATDEVGLSPPRRRWWLVIAWVWTVAELVALAGLSWLGGLAVLDYLRLPLPDVPDAIGALPWPTALLIGGVLAWLLIGALRNRLIAVGAGRHRRATLRRLNAVVARVAEERALTRVRSELNAHDALVTALEQAAG